MRVSDASRKWLQPAIGFPLVCIFAPDILEFVNGTKPDDQVLPFSYGNLKDTRLAIGGFHRRT